MVARRRVGHLVHRQVTGLDDQAAFTAWPPARGSQHRRRGSGAPKTSEPGTTPSAPAAPGRDRVGRMPPSTTTSGPGAVPGRDQLADAARRARVLVVALDPDHRAHQQQPVDVRQIRCRVADRLVQFQAERSPAAQFPDPGQRRGDVGARAALHGDHVGAGLGEPARPVVRVGHVEMHIQHRAGPLAQRGDQVRPEEQLRDVMPVEDVDVEAVRDVAEPVDRRAERQQIRRPQRNVSLHRWWPPEAVFTASRASRSTSSAPGVSASSSTGLCGTGANGGADPQHRRVQLAEQALRIAAAISAADPPCR